MVRQWQELLHGERYYQLVREPADFVKSCRGVRDAKGIAALTPPIWMTHHEMLEIRRPESELPLEKHEKRSR